MSCLLISFSARIPQEYVDFLETGSVVIKINFCFTQLLIESLTNPKMGCLILISIPRAFKKDDREAEIN